MFVLVPGPLLSERFALIIEGLCRLVAARGAQQRASGALVVLIWTRLRRMAARFASLAIHGPAALRAAARPPDTPRAPRPPTPRLPRGFAWLIQALPEAACFGEQLRHLLAEPEMTALLTATPRLARLLDPLCRMLAVEPPATAQPASAKLPSRARARTRPRSARPHPWRAPAPASLAQVARRLCLA